MPNEFNYLENKNVTNWQDLDDLAYNNHFANGQCYFKVDFNRQFSENDDAILPITLPVYPEDISFGANTNYTNAEIIGRPGTISGYVSTSDVSTRINLHLHRELEIPGVIASDKNQIDKIIATIQACDYPRVFPDGLATPIVTYVFGDTKITGKQTSFNTKWSGPKIGNSYMDVILDIAISHVPNGIIFFDNVRNFVPRQFE